MVQGGLPVGSSVVLQGPPGQEKLRFALTFLADGLKSGGSGLVVTSSQSPETVIADLRDLGVNLDSVTNENRLRVVDWYSWSEETVQDIEERGIVIRSSMDLTNLGVALSRAIAALAGDGPRRAVIELLSPATSSYEVTQVYAFAQSAKRKFDRHQFTSLVLLEKEMHSSPQLTTLHQPFDGVIEIERTRSGDRIVRTIGVLHLKDTAPDPTFRVLEISEAGIRVLQDTSQTAPPGSSARGSVLESQDDRAQRLRLILQIATERLKLNPGDADALFAMAAAQATLDDAKGGLQTLDRLADLDSAYPGLWVLKTKLHANLGQAELARQSRLRALETEPKAAKAIDATVPCPMCEAPVPIDATTCASCGVKFAPTRTLEDELDDLGHAAIQEMVQEELASQPNPEPEARPPTPPARKPAAQKSPAKPSSKRGMTNGLVLGRGASRRAGMTNGLKGRTNGLRGRTNGLTNNRGRTNGLTNGVDRTNGLTNGVGRTNGLTNGLGRTNGLTNGLGRTNGITNGLGRTNGLTNGLGGGRPAGFHSSGVRGMMRNAGWKLYLIPLVSVALLLVPLFLVPQYGGPTYPIQIDGLFADWAEVPRIPSNATGLNPNVDITEVAVTDNVDFLSFYAEVRGTALQGDPSPNRMMDALFVFIDTDRSAATGYSVQGLGADRMIEIDGWGGHVASASLMEFDSNRDRRDWGGWSKQTTVPAAVAGREIEFEASWEGIVQPKAPIDAAFAARSWDGAQDIADTTATSASSFVVVRQHTRAPQVASGAQTDIAFMTFQAVGGDVQLASLNVTFEGTFGSATISSVALANGANTVAQTGLTGNRARFTSLGLIIPLGQSLTLGVRPAIAVADGTTVGAVLANVSDVVPVNGGVALKAPKAVPDSFAYAGAIPAGVRVDGGFAEWANDTSDLSGDVTPVQSADQDISRYAFRGSSGSVFFMVQTVGTALNGSFVPVAARAYPSSGTSQPDSDRDGVPDSVDPFPYDFNNDGIPDAATNGDYDADGIVDYGFPGGTDFWLNTTIPSTFPAAYAGRFVSVYIGPVQRPVELGKDVARFYLDADGNAGTGYSIGGVGADYLVEITGKTGRILTSSDMLFNGTNPGQWTWATMGTAAAAKDGSRIEASLTSVPIANSSRAFFEISAWDGSKDDTTPTAPTRTFAPRSMVQTSGVLGDLAVGSGGAAGDLYGWNITGVGKINENSGGFEDFVVGAPNVDFGGQTDRGAIYLFFGSSGWSPANINAASANVVIYGAAAGAHFGWTISAANDVNGDGYQDILVGAPDAGAGKAYLIYGRTDWSAANGASIASVSSTVTISGQNTGDKFGSSVAGLGNIDNSGNTDFAVGAYAYGSAKGRVYVFYGDGSIATSAIDADVLLDGSAAGDKFGFSIAGAGNVNNDAYQDLVVGAPGASKAYVYTLAINPVVNGHLVSDATGWTYGEVDPNGFDSGAWDNSGGSGAEFSGAGSYKFTFTDTTSSATLYFHQEIITANTQAGNLLTITAPDQSNAVSSTVTFTASGQHLLLGNWTTPALGVTTLPAGTWSFTFHASAGVKVTDGRIDVHIYRRSASGTLTAIDGTNGNDATDGVAATTSIGNVNDYFGSYSMAATSLAATDALVIKVYGKSVTIGTGTGNYDLTFSYDANNAQSKVVSTASFPEVRYFHVETASVNGFTLKQILTALPDQGTTQSVQVSPSSAGHYFLGEWTSAPLGITSIPAGDWNFLFWGTSAATEARFDVHIYKRSSAGADTSLDGTDGLNATNGVAVTAKISGGSALYVGSANLASATLATTDTLVVRVYARVVTPGGSSTTTFQFDATSKNSRFVYPGFAATDRLYVISANAFPSPPGTFTNIRYRFSFASTVTNLGDAYYKVRFQIRDGADTVTVVTAYDSGSRTAAQSWAIQTGTFPGLFASTSYRVRIIVDVYDIHRSQTPSLTVNIDDISLQFEIVATLTGSASTNFGWAVATAGNIDNDATPYADVAVGAPDDGNGKVFLFYGSGSFDSTVDVTITGAASGDKFGYAVSTAGDATGDGIADLIVGAPYHDNGATTDAGAVYVFGGSVSLPSAMTTSNANSYRYGDAASDHLGWSVSYSNPDGTSPTELLAGAPHSDAGGTDAGMAYVLRIPEFEDALVPISLAVVLPLVWAHRRKRKGWPT